MKRSEAIMWGIGIFGTIGTIVSLAVLFIPNTQELSNKISSDMDLANSDCLNLNNAERIHLQQTLLMSQKSLNVEGNYSKAVDLLNSVGNDLKNCNPEAIFSFSPIFVIAYVFIAILIGSVIVRHFFI